MAAARKHDASVSNDYAGRSEEIDELENEIINNYSNTPDLRLSKIADPINCQQVISASVSILGRITEIYNGALKNKGKLNAMQGTLMDGILPLMQGGSAETRTATARGCMQTITYLIALEEGLITICESTQKNIKATQEMASRTLKAIEMDLVYFEGKDALARIVKESKMNLNA
jgi:hypothetical protein